jgi:hypothetical protein
MIGIKPLFKIVLTCILYSLFFILYSGQVEASSFDLSVSPSIFQIELTPPAVADVKETLTLENNSDEPLPLTLSYRPFRPDGDNGELVYLGENESIGNDPLILQRISLMDNGKRLESFIIPPKTKKQYDLVISIPKDEPPGDYYFSLIFLAQDDSLPITPLLSGEGQGEVNQAKSPIRTTGSQALGGVATNILLSIGPKSKTTGTIEDFSTPLFQPQGPVAFNVKIKNTSDHFIYPKAQILITNMFGQNIGKIELLPVNILSHSIRSLPSREQFVIAAEQDELRRTNKELSKDKSLYSEFIIPDSAVAIWPEKFLIGPYHATLTIAFSDEGPLYERSILFIGAPIYIFIGLGLAVLLVLTIRSRLKHHDRTT